MSGRATSNKSDWESRVRPFKETLNEKYDRVRATKRLGSIAVSATDFKRQLAGKGEVAVQSVGHWLAYPGRSPRQRLPGAKLSLKWTEANARVPSTRDDLWSLVLALAKEGALWADPNGDHRGLLDYEAAAGMATSLEFVPVPVRLLEEASRGKSLAPLIIKWTRALDSTSPTMMDAILRHLLGDVIGVQSHSAPPGIMCVAGLSPPATSGNALIESVLEFLRRRGSYGVVIPFDLEASSDSSRIYRTEVVREWIEFVRSLRLRWQAEAAINDADKRLRLLVPALTKKSTADSDTSLALAMRMMPPFLGEEARPLLIAVHTGLPPDNYKYRVGVIVRGADGARRLTQRYPIEDFAIKGTVPIELVSNDSADDDRRFRAEADCAATREFFSDILKHWQSNGHQHLGGEIRSDTWRFVL